MITIGIDTHQSTLVASAIDGTGGELTAGAFPNDVQGHALLVAWANEQRTERRFGIESSGAYGAAFARLLVGAGESVVRHRPSSAAGGPPPQAAAATEIRG